MTTYNAMLKSLPEFKIDKVSFKFMSDEHVKRQSVVNVTNKAQEGDGSVNDIKLGTTKNNELCGTCGLSIDYCTGHYGHIELEIPIINPEAKDIVLALLTCVCNTCSSLMLSKTFIKNEKMFNGKYGVQRLNAMRSITEKSGKCTRKGTKEHPSCYINRLYKTKDNKNSNEVMYMTIYHRSSTTVKCNEENKNIISVEEIYNILDGIRDEDLPYLGFLPSSPHPRDFIMKSIVVPPTYMRHTTYHNGKKIPFFVTSYLTQIVTENEKIKVIRANEPATMENDLMNCKKKITDAMYSMICANGKAGVSAVEYNKSLHATFNGKKGRPRRDGMGKKVNYSARSPIDGDSTLPFGWIGIPKEMAKKLTKPIRVTHYNFKKVKSWHANDMIRYIVPATGKSAGMNMMVTKNNKHKLEPKIGDVVHRELIEGDNVTFNRQPTLHMGSLLSFRIKIHDGKNIRIGSQITDATHGDFDGDEGNFLDTQTPAALLECFLFKSSWWNIINPRDGSVMLGLYYHAALGMYLLSDDRVVLSEENWMKGFDMLKCDRSVSELFDDCEREGVERWSGKSLISALFTREMNFDIEGVVVKNGVMIKGTLTRKVTNDYGIISYLNYMYTRYTASKFLTEAQWLFDWYLKVRGFGTSLRDMIPKDVDAVNEIKRKEVERIQKAADEEKTEEETLLRIAKEEKNYKNYMYKYIDEKNPIRQCVESGAKGKPINIKCVSFSYGQEVNRDVRPKLTISDKKRFSIYDPMPTNKDEERKVGNNVKTRGFIEDNFLDGLSPNAFAAHMDNGRDGINTSARATPEAGTINRKLNNFMNSVRLSPWGSPQFTFGGILNYHYADGFDQTKLIINKSYIYGEDLYFMNMDWELTSIIAKEVSRRNEK